MPNASKRSNWLFDGWEVRKPIFFTPAAWVSMDRGTV
jgi:hypothetical protein